MDNNTYWKRISRETGLNKDKDKDKDTKTNDIDFNIDLDHYDGDTLVSGLRDFIRDDILLTKYQTFNRKLTLKNYFDKLKL